MYSFENDKPIYLQIYEIIKNDIISGKYGLGEKLPSVRELAVMLKVNPNTLQKSLAELEEQGLIFTERTNGKFVTNDKNIINMRRREQLEQRIDEFLKDMKSIGAENGEVSDLLKQKMKGEF